MKSIFKPLMTRFSKKDGSPLHFPIWLQLSIATTLIIVFISFSLSLVILNRRRKQLYEQSGTIGMVSLNYFANNARIPLLENNIIELNTLIKDASTVEELVYAFIVDNNNRIKAHTQHDKIEKIFEGFENEQNNRKDGLISSFDYCTPGNEHILNISRPIIFKEKKLGQVNVGVSIDFIEQIIKKEKASIIILTIFIIIIGILITTLFAFHFTRRISKLVIATEEIAKGNYNYKMSITGNDELGHLARAFNKMKQSLWINSLMQKSFGKYVGQEVLNMILKDPESVWLKGCRNEATILFCDIRGFTSYSETNEPEDVVEKLNEYFEIASRVIFDHHGYIDKFIGDSVLAVFGVPAHHEKHIEMAVRAAVKMQSEFCKAARNDNKLLSSIGIAINTGIVVSGNIGSPVKMEYTVIGDSVNLASRLTRFAGPGEIIVNKNIFEQIGDVIDMIPLPPRKIKGKSEIVEPYKVNMLNIREMPIGNVYS
ncbi:MAG: adenylate/guanylate cyclase domain-containing protein [bacterium]